MISKIDLKGEKLTTPNDWVKIILSSDEMKEGEKLGSLQEVESKKLKLNDRSFLGDEKDSLKRSIAAKQAELAVKKYGGGTARLVQINEFHDHPDVGQVNVRFTFNSDYGLMITKRDQNNVPIILCTGEPPIFYLMGWIIPGYIKHLLYKLHQGRCQDCQSTFGFLQEMKEHECCCIPASMLLPINILNTNLIS